MKKITKKLTLNKQTISTLSHNTLGILKAGYSGSGSGSSFDRRVACPQIENEPVIGVYAECITDAYSCAGCVIIMETDATCPKQTCPILV